MHELRFHATGEAFLRAVEPTLIRHEARHSLAYGLARRFAENGYEPGNAGDPQRPTERESERVVAGHLLTVWNGDQLDLGAWHTPPNAFCITGFGGEAKR